MKKILGSIIIFLASAGIGALAYYLMPKYTMWLNFGINGSLTFLLVILAISGLIFGSVFIAFIPPLVAGKFDLLGNKVIAAIASVLLGVPVIIRQVLNWRMYVPAYQYETTHVEGGTIWTTLLCFIFPGLVFIGITFASIGFLNNDNKLTD